MANPDFARYCSPYLLDELSEFPEWGKDAVVLVDEISAYAASERSTCVHYWIIEIPSGPLSNGFCKHCRARRQFENYIGLLDEISPEQDKPYRWRDIRIRKVASQQT
jgi:hypothetical protein|tara:strand:+ start:248 stop:568 length:321 start_codon:yes stop_codon:yes gene_type:complete